MPGPQLAVYGIIANTYVQPRTEDEIKEAERRIIKRQNQKKRKMDEAGIKYDFDAVAYVSCAIVFLVRTC